MQETLPIMTVYKQISWTLSAHERLAGRLLASLIQDPTQATKTLSNLQGLMTLLCQKYKEVIILQEKGDFSLLIYAAGTCRNQWIPATTAPTEVTWDTTNLVDVL